MGKVKRLFGQIPILVICLFAISCADQKKNSQSFSNSKKNESEKVLNKYHKKMDDEFLKRVGSLDDNELDKNAYLHLFEHFSFDYDEFYQVKLNSDSADIFQIKFGGYNVKTGTGKDTLIFKRRTIVSVREVKRIMDSEPIRSFIDNYQPYIVGMLDGNSRRLILRDKKDIVFERNEMSENDTLLWLAKSLDSLFLN